MLPYLVGFVPHESLVLVWLAAGRVTLTARIDLADAQDPEALRHLVLAQRARMGQSEVIAVAFGEDELQSRTALSNVVDICGADVIDALRATQDRWWSQLCHDPLCCPEEGHVWDPREGIAAEAVFAGMSTLASRDELSRYVCLAEDQPRAERLFSRQIARMADMVLPARKTRMLALLRRWTSKPTRISPNLAIEAAVLLTHPEVRDVATLFLESGNAEALVDVWTQVVSHAIPRYAAAPLGELGLAAWVSGNGALMLEALQGARELQPDHGLVGILEDIQANIVPPSAWADLRPVLAS